MPETEHVPKCLVGEIGGRRLLDWLLDAFSRAGVEDIVFVGGYRLDAVRTLYPDLRYYENPHWDSTEMLASLMCAAPEFTGELLVSYTDLLYTSCLVERLLASEGEATLAVDPGWRSRYVGRADELAPAAETVELQGSSVHWVGKHSAERAGDAEFVGLARFSSDVTERARSIYAHRQEVPRAPFQQAPDLPMSRLTDLLQELIDDGVDVGSVVVDGAWFELDTLHDLEQARAHYRDAGPMTSS